MIEAPDLDAVRKLTSKQKEVLERVARHQANKTIADAMGVSETRVNQHIRAIKDRLGVNDKEDLVSAWIEANAAAPLRESVYRKKQLPNPGEFGDESATADAALFRFKDAGAIPLKAPWEIQGFNRVGPGLLDGPGATARRVGFIILVAIGFPVAVVLTLSAMIALTDMLRSLH